MGRLPDSRHVFMFRLSETGVIRTAWLLVLFVTWKSTARKPVSASPDCATVSAVSTQYHWLMQLVRNPAHDVSGQFWQVMSWRQTHNMQFDQISFFWIRIRWVNFTERQAPWVFNTSFSKRFVFALLRSKDLKMSVSVTRQSSHMDVIAFLKEKKLDGVVEEFQGRPFLSIYCSFFS